MDLTTYAGLQAAVATFLIRTDQSANIPGLIQLGEVRLNRVLRMRLAEADTALISVSGSRTIPLPAAYAEALNVWLTPAGSLDRSELFFVDPVEIRVQGEAGRPYAWTIDGANLAFERPCDQAYAITLRMLSKWLLSDAAPTNKLLTDCPDAYLYATLCEAGPLLRDQDLLTMFEAKLTRAIGEVNDKEARSRAQQKLGTEPGQLLRARRSSGFNIYNGY